MMGEPASIPLFRRPPVDEVAISVQFQPIDGFLDEHIRGYWQTIRSEYPIAQLQPRIEGPIESKDPSPPVQLQLQISAMAPSAGRMWLISEADDYLIQVQDTRFIQNWRRRDADYPRFESINDLFWRNYRKFRQYLASIDLPQPQVQQVEVTYIDWIPNIPMSEFLKPAGVSSIRTPTYNLQAEEQNWTARYLMRADDEFIERLYVQCLPAVRPQNPGVPGSQLAFTSRAARRGGIAEEEVADLIRTGRLNVVNAFVSLTIESAQESWERVR